nr:hypothetical protein [Tanacetum cinerariifolium]
MAMMKILKSLTQQTQETQLKWPRASQTAINSFPVTHQPPQETSVEILHDHENELAEYINTPSWNRPVFFNNDDDDDEKYTIAITLILSTEEPVDSLIMEHEHPDTILKMESDEVIKSSVEDLVPILSESEGIRDNMCDVPFCDNSSPLDISKDQFEDNFNSNDDSTSSDNDYFCIDDIDYVEASPPDSKLVSLKEVKDDILREKLLNIYLLIAKIDSLNDNPLLIGEFTSVVIKDNLGEPRGHVPNVLPTYPILMQDSDFIPSDDSLGSDLEGEFTSVVMKDNLGEPRGHVPNVLPTYPILMQDLDFIPSDDSLGSDLEGEFTSVVMEVNLGEPRGHVPNVLPTHPILMQDSNFIPSDDSLGSDLEVSFPFGTRNKISNPGIFFDV